MRDNKNCMEVVFDSKSINEGFARVCVASFLVQLNPSLDELNEIKAAVSEAVTNCVVHAYPKKKGKIRLKCEIDEGDIVITVSDEGVGIRDIAKAREPFYTTKPNDERSGMGFSVIEAFMDEVDVQHNNSKGTIVIMRKKIESERDYRIENA